MQNELKIKLYTVTIDCKDHTALAAFYAKLLHWEVVFQDEEWACVGAPNVAQGAYPGITIQKNPFYVPPVWPEEENAQQQMEHLDFIVNDLEAAVSYAISCGARVASTQFSKEGRVMLDPAGHPFCLCQMKAVIDSPTFALR